MLSRRNFITATAAAIPAVTFFGFDAIAALPEPGDKLIKLGARVLAGSTRAAHRHAQKTLASQMEAFLEPYRHNPIMWRRHPRMDKSEDGADGTMYTLTARFRSLPPGSPVPYAVSVDLSRPTPGPKVDD